MIVRNIDHPEVIQTRYLAHNGAAACMLLDSRILEGLLFFAHAVLKSGREIEAHVDPYEEVYYLLSGRGVMTVGGEQQEVAAGDAIWLPYGVPHSLLNDGDEDCVILVAAAAI
jgi:oxalate decarboxylase/phosphoglucose isomerase-like protein (cupin superfamily)